MWFKREAALEPVAIVKTPKAHARGAVLIALLVAGTTGAGAATFAIHPRQEQTPACTWGASSITARLVDGQWIVGKQHTSGCLPRP